MNQQLIDQLAQTCWRSRQLTHSAHSWHSDFDRDRFAKLILFECVKIAVFKGDRATAQAIKEHFGLAP